MSIFIVLFSLFLWGENYGMQSAFGDVYSLFTTDLDRPLASVKTSEHPVGSRNIILNGSQSKVTLSYSNESINTIMNELEEFSRSNLDQAGAVDELDSHLIQILTRPYQTRGKNSAVFVHQIQAIEPGKGAEVLQRLAEKKSFGGYAKLGYTVVLKRAENGRTAIWKTEFNSDRDFFTFLENKKNEPAGNDILSVPGFPGSQRMISLAENTAIGQSYVTAYEGKGTLKEHAQYYQTLLYQAGLKERSVIRSTKGITINYYKPDYQSAYEVTIFMSKSQSKQHETMDIIELSVKS